MPVTTRALDTDPLRNFKFNVYVPLPDPTGKGQKLSKLGFMSMSGLGIQIEPLTYREGGDNLTTRKLPGQADFNPITLSRGLFPGSPWNWNWMTMIFTAMYGGGQTPTNADFRTTVYINILQHPVTNNAKNYGPYVNGSWPQQNSLVKVSFALYSCWIGSLAYSDLDAGGNAVAIEQLTLNYEGFDSKWSSFGANVVNPTTWAASAPK